MKLNTVGPAADDPAGSYARSSKWASTPSPSTMPHDPAYRFPWPTLGEARSVSPEPVGAWADVEARFPFLREDDGVHRRPRKLLTARQSAVLHKILERTYFPSTEERIAVARELHLSPRKVQVFFQNKVVQVFFQNKRQKHRRQGVSGGVGEAGGVKFPGQLSPSGDHHRSAGPEARRRIGVAHRPSHSLPEGAKFYQGMEGHASCYGNEDSGAVRSAAEPMIKCASSGYPLSQNGFSADEHHLRSHRLAAQDYSCQSAYEAGSAAGLPYANRAEVRSHAAPMLPDPQSDRPAALLPVHRTGRSNSTRTRPPHSGSSASSRFSFPLGPTATPASSTFPYVVPNKAALRLTRSETWFTFSCGPKGPYDSHYRQGFESQNAGAEEAPAMPAFWSQKRIGVATLAENFDRMTASATQPGDEEESLHSTRCDDHPRSALHPRCLADHGEAQSGVDSRPSSDSKSALRLPRIAELGL
ncbi:SILENCED MATING-TYPE PROTEIN A1 [Ceraceosorus bombacis]|uniref:SILENCED MATING-TYPE PROTEIN A1 n=1 Tax=Ceraceosorus bombacis TaxID=401625 RepID=A0A0P1BNX9_9BASI|nr:SILENCED MATING-TYPE PROTEIN A1 [Ceraceosorus bombacis]